MPRLPKQLPPSPLTYMIIAILFLVLSIGAHMLFMKGKYDSLQNVKEKFSDCSSGFCGL